MNGSLTITWAKMDIEQRPSPSEIAENYLAVVIMDNDDFKSGIFIQSPYKCHVQHCFQFPYVKVDLLVQLY